MTIQTHTAPVASRFAPLRAVFQSVIDWLQTSPDVETPAPSSDRLRRDAGLDEHVDHDLHRQTAQTYRDRYMPLL